MGRRGWVSSGILHGGVIAAALLGLPSLFQADAEFVEDHRLRNIIQRYSDHISFPIKMLEKSSDEEDKEKDKLKIIAGRVLNKQ